MRDVRCGWLERFEDLQGMQAPWRRINRDSASHVQVVRHRVSCYLLAYAQQRKKNIAFQCRCRSPCASLIEKTTIRELKMQWLHVNMQVLATTCAQLAQLVSSETNLLSLLNLTTTQVHHSWGLPGGLLGPLGGILGRRA